MMKIIKSLDSKNQAVKNPPILQYNDSAVTSPFERVTTGYINSRIDRNMSEIINERINLITS